MKNILAGLLAILITCSAVAQKAKTKPNTNHRKTEKANIPGKKFQPKQVYANLDLSKEQKMKLKTVNESFKDQLKELHKNESITVKEQRERREALTTQHRAEVEAILTAEQKEELKDEKKKLRTKVAAAGAKKLDLTAQQSEKLKAVNQEFKTNVQAVKKNETLTQQERKEKMTALQNRHSEEIKAILTEEQREKLEDLKKNQPNRKVK